jgi:hypothetical protein
MPYLFFGMALSPSHSNNCITTFRSVLFHLYVYEVSPFASTMPTFVFNRIMSNPLALCLASSFLFFYKCVLRSQSRNCGPYHISICDVHEAGIDPIPSLLFYLSCLAPLLLFLGRSHLPKCLFLDLMVQKHVHAKAH